MAASTSSRSTATAVGTDPRYTPAPGYFGSDTLRHSLTVGDRTVDAGVVLTRWRWCRTRTRSRTSRWHSRRRMPMLTTPRCKACSAPPALAASAQTPTAANPTSTTLLLVQAFTAADETVGTRWAGVLSVDSSPIDATCVDQDVLKVVDASTASFERSGHSGTYRLVDGKLAVTVNGAVPWVYEPAVVFKAQASAAFTAGGLTQRWESYINVGVTAGKFMIDLHADGSALGISVDVNGKESVAQSGTWALTDGAMVFNRYQNRTAGRQWLPALQRAQLALLGTVGKRIYVMERMKFTNSSYDQYRVNVYTGP